MKKNEKFPVYGNREKMTALELSEEALNAKNTEKNEIAIKLAKALKELPFQIVEKELKAEELSKTK